MDGTFEANDAVRRRGARWSIGGWLILAVLCGALIASCSLAAGDVKSDLVLTSMMALCAIASGYVATVIVLLLCRALRDVRAVVAAAVIAVLLSIMWPALIAAANDAAAVRARAAANR